MMCPAVSPTPSRSAIQLRRANAQDLGAINAVIEGAVMTWHLPERVKRLSLPSYRYHAQDLEHLHVVVAENGAGTIVGVAAWEAARRRDVPSGQRGLLLHGIYVDPAWQHQGIGRRLLESASAACRVEGFDGLLVKAQADAEGFFAAQGMQRLPVEDEARDYPLRFWQPTRQTKASFAAFAASTPKKAM
jgi:N-acetylglutamate synthase-like GNAT family acetyltransferase